LTQTTVIVVISFQPQLVPHTWKIINDDLRKEFCKMEAQQTV